MDTVGNPERYQAKLTKVFNNRIEFTVAKKADSLYKVVSAASICAKVTRDVDLDAWQFAEPGFCATGSMGSGYPGGPCVPLLVWRPPSPVLTAASLLQTK